MQPAYAETVVVVTGASTGLGRAIAVGAARLGARTVVINYASNLVEAEITARETAEAGAEPVLVKGDVGQDEDCRRIVAAAEAHKRIDVLFNNAGISRIASYGDLDGLSADDFLNIYRVNVVGPYQMIRAARGLLENSEFAAVVNTSSVAGITGGGS